MSPQSSEDEIDEAHPRSTTLLFGHAAAEQALLSAYRSGRVPHAFLLSGPKGIGKATLAYRMARFVFAHPDPAAADVAAADSLAIDAEPSGGAPDCGSGARRSSGAGTHGERQRRTAPANRRRRRAPHSVVFRLDGRRGRLAHRHRRCGRRTEPVERQRAAQGSGGAAAARAAAAGVPLGGARAGDAALALPHGDAAGAGGAGRGQGRSCRHRRRGRRSGRDRGGRRGRGQCRPGAGDCSTKTRWRCASKRSICSTACRGSTPVRCTHSATAWPGPIRSRSMPWSIRSMSGWRSGSSARARHAKRNRPHGATCRGLGGRECGRARRRNLQFGAKTVCFRRVRLACRGHARLIPTADARTAVLHHHRDCLSERPAAYRPRL